MKTRRRGKIVNICSLASDLGRPNIVAYATSKGALRMFTRALAVELAPHRRLQIGAFGDVEQRVQRHAVVALAGEVGVQRADTQREITRTRRVGLDQAGKRGAGQPLRMRIEAGERAHAACFGIE